TIVSPCRTTTAPEACLAILPVSREISVPPISTATRVTASLLIFTAFLFRPSVGGPFLFSQYPNPRSLADGQPTLGRVAAAESAPRRPLRAQAPRGSSVAAASPSRSTSRPGSSPGE